MEYYLRLVKMQFLHTHTQTHKHLTHTHTSRQASTSKHKQAQASTSKRKQAHASTSKHKQAQASTSKHKQAQAGAHTQAGTSKQRHTHTHTHTHPHPHPHTHTHTHTHTTDTHTHTNTHKHAHAQTVKQTSCLGGFREAIRFLFEWSQAQRVAATRGDEKALSTSPWAGTYIHWSVSSVSRKLWLALAFAPSPRHVSRR